MNYFFTEKKMGEIKLEIREKDIIFSFITEEVKIEFCLRDHRFSFPLGNYYRRFKDDLLKDDLGLEKGQRCNFYPANNSDISIILSQDSIIFSTQEKKENGNILEFSISRGKYGSKLAEQFDMILSNKNFVEMDEED